MSKKDENAFTRIVDIEIRSYNTWEQKVDMNALKR